jgi:hypothetical protein
MANMCGLRNFQEKAWLTLQVIKTLTKLQLFNSKACGREARQKVFTEVTYNGTCMAD